MTADTAAAWRFDALGTQWSIETPSPLSPEVAGAISARVAEYDRTWSRFRRDAAIAPLAEAAGRVELPAESRPMARLYRRLYDLTDGALTPLVGSSLERLGYSADGVHDTGLSPRPAPSWDAVMTWEGTTLTARAPITLDVGAAGKGQVVDLLSDLLHESGVPDHVVDGSGDVRHRGRGDRGRPTRIALEDPRSTGRAIGVLELGDAALCSSAVNRRRWGGHHHVLDARSGSSTTEVLGSWVMARSAMLADALATALFFVPASTLAPHFDFDHAVMTADGRVAASGLLRRSLLLGRTPR